MGAQAQPAQLDADTLVRRRLITFVAAGLSVFSLYFLVRRLADYAVDSTSVLLASGMLLMAGVAWWARRTTGNGPAHLMCATLMTIVVSIAYDNGGTTAPAVEWFIVITMMALFLVGPRTSMVYAVLSSLGFVGFHLATVLDYPLPVPPDADYLAQDRLFSRVVTLCFVVLIGWRFAREKLRATTRAHAAKEDLDVVLRNLPHGVLVIRGGVVRSANEAVAQMLDTSPDQLAGIPIGSLVSVPDEGPRTLSGAHTFECTLTPRAGEPVAVRITPVTLRDVQSNQVLVLSIEDLRQQIALETQLRTSQRMASLGTMAAGMAHEINNPLACVATNLDYARGYVGAPQDHPGSDDEAVEALADAEEGVRRIAQVVRDLQLFSSGEARRPSTQLVYVEQCVRSAQRICRAQLEVIDALDMDVAPDAMVKGDEGELVRVFVNLLVNAAQAMRDADSPQKRIAVRARPLDRWVEIEVEDTGPGLEPGVEEQLFDPFFTTKEVGEGMGLGLAICHQLVRGRGGTIRVQSEPGQGTTFVLRLRRAEPSPDSIQTIDIPDEPLEPSDTPLRVLVVEDDAMVVRALQRVLDPSTVFTTEGGEALEHLARARFDAILCDVMMPGMSGPEFFARVRSEHPTMVPRVVFMTGGAFTDEARAFLDKLDNRCLAKPIQSDQLRATLSTLGRRA